MFVPLNIVNLCEQEQKNRQNVDENQVSVASVVEWLVVISVNAVCNCISRLDVH
jgi:hypothetical protein